MGDCRVRVLIARELLETPPVDNNTSSSSDGSFHAVTRVFSADTTVREVVEALLRPMVWRQRNDQSPQLLPQHVCLWDCTIHPPRDITDWPTKNFPDKEGPKSKTLYDAGWFPSGTLQLLPVGTPPSLATADTYTDVQYNSPTTETTQHTSSSGGVRLVDPTSGEIQTETAMPSQVLHSVTSRHRKEDDETPTTSQALQTRRENRVARQEKEKERNRKLEERIQQLEAKSSNKNKKTSQLVKTMLIKSRCTGSKSLDTKDRVYLHCMVIVGESNAKSEYRYFSQQDTVGRVASFLQVRNNPSVDAEFLIRTGDSEYRRLPVTMRLYEAMSQNYIKEVDSIVIRCFSPDSDEPTTSILEERSEGAVENKESDGGTEPATSSNMESAEMDISSDKVRFERLHQALEAMDAAEAAKSKKQQKKSKTSAAVRTMLIKGRAKGDAKRIPRIEDRFFLELVVLNDCQEEIEPRLSFVFLAKTDPVGRLLRDCVQESGNFQSMVLVPTEDGGFHNVSLELTWREVEAKGIVKPFDRVVVRLHND